MIRVPAASIRVLATSTGDKLSAACVDVKHGMRQ